MNIDTDTIKWVVGISIPAFATIVVFAGKRIAKRNDEKRKEREEKLEQHFDDLNLNVIEQIADLSWQATNQNGKLTHANNVAFRSVHSFEQGDLYASFELHFPEFADEWKRLKQKAVTLNIIQQGTDVNPEQVEKTKSVFTEAELLEMAERLSEEFRALSLKLYSEMDNVRKYGMGRAFKRLKKCLICHRF